MKSSVTPKLAAPRWCRITEVICAALLVPLISSACKSGGGGGGGDVDARVWVNDGGDKVMRHENRAKGASASTINSVWDGTRVRVFGARNETVSFNVILEAGSANRTGVSVSQSELSGPGSAAIGTVARTGDGVFNTVGRNIELFFVRYLRIEGLSALSYGTYDERHVPSVMRRPFTGAGIASGVWEDRAGADKEFPEIAVPLEWVGAFDVAKNQNQSIWVDVTIPKGTPAGVYKGTFSIRVGSALWREVPVELTVRGFTLPDVPTAKTMLYVGYPDLSRRYTGVTWPNNGTVEDQKVRRVRDRHFQMAHRHRISVIDSDVGAAVSPGDRPRDEWLPRLNGSLYTAASGYSGPGENTGNGVYSIGTYGQWGWKAEGEPGMRAHTDAWASWFAANSPSTETFLYLIDESTNYAQTEQWAQWVANNPGPGSALKTFATIHLPHADDDVPSLNIAASWFAIADPAVWGPAKDSFDADASKRFMVYNGKRPANGSFATEDDGVALRQVPWAQEKMGVHRWFFWESTYYNDYQGGRGQTDVWNVAQTFGGTAPKSPIRGKTGWNYSNGDGVLFYPGTDTDFPGSSYGREGPAASLRLKHWRRGIQDVEYLALARAADAVTTQEILERMVPKALWENGVDDPSDPTWKRTDIPWSIDPDDWEQARAELADLIE
ncbi:MAG: DUF4091 domain-containing protein [Bdellovibrionales bacterium]|nr:DUF4091 domain-containing protein [Bdellovibrionales bacterium]